MIEKKIMVNFSETAKNESVYHAALIISKGLKIGTKESNKKAARQLKEHGSLEAIFKSQLSLFHTENPLQNIPDINGIIAATRKTNFGITTIIDDNFPEQLREIEGIFPVLYFQGDISLTQGNTFAVVGTRELEQEEIATGRLLTERLVNKGNVIVSGLAKGCDTIAHRTALDCKGKTIAVIGTRLNKYSPITNKELQEEIAQNHLLLSPYPIGVRTFPQHFAYRNILIAGLANQGLLVIKADDNSGTQHAIGHCLEQGKNFMYLN